MRAEFQPSGSMMWEEEEEVIDGRTGKQTSSILEQIPIQNF